MIASQGFPSPHHHQHGSYQEAADSYKRPLTVKTEFEGSEAAMTSGGTPSDDPFSSAASFGEEDFDIPPINIPPAALDDNNMPPSQSQQIQQQQQQQQYMQQQQQQQHPQHGSYYHQQQQMHPQHQQMYHQQQQQQQQWGYGNNYPYPAGEQQQHYGYGYQQGMYGQGHPHQGHHAMPGGPSPGGSHNTPSPQAHSEDGDILTLGEQHQPRNNNILKQHEHYQHNSQHHPHMMHHGGPPNHGNDLRNLVVPRPPLTPSNHVAVARKPKVSKRKKKRDPNEPTKPVSAYALFFRDNQANIKAANPNAAFGDVSKVVASMWDNLDPESKAAYKKRTENAKKDYLKKLAAYRASLVSKGNGDAYGPYAIGYAAYAESAALAQQKAAQQAGGYTPNGGSYLGTPVPPRPPIQHHHAMHAHPHMAGRPGVPPSQHSPAAGGYGPGMMQHGQQAMHNGMMASHPHNRLHPQHHPQQQQQQPPTGTPVSTSTSTATANSPSSPNETSSNQNGTTGPGPVCKRPGCSNAVSRSREGWNNEFCSNECVVGQCKDVYTNWSGHGQGPQHREQSPPNRPHENAYQAAQAVN